MKAKCIKADPLEWLTVGDTYECKEYGLNVIIEGTGVAVSRVQFKEMFEKVVEVRIGKPRKATGVLDRLIKEMKDEKAKM